MKEKNSDLKANVETLEKNKLNIQKLFDENKELLNKAVDEKSELSEKLKTLEIEKTSQSKKIQQLSEQLSEGILLKSLLKHFINDTNL